jgi:hypothetical protein
VPFAGEGDAQPVKSDAVLNNDMEELHGDEMELVSETKVSKEGNDRAAAASPSHRRRHRRQRVTPLDLVQQVSLLLIPELKKLRVASQMAVTMMTSTSTSAKEMETKTMP